MEITLTTNHKLNAKELGKALTDVTPEEFAAFWLSFANHISVKKLDEFAKEMSRNLGSKRKITLKELVELIIYYENYNKRIKNLKETNEINETNETIE